MNKPVEPQIYDTVAPRLVEFRFDQEPPIRKFLFKGANGAQLLVSTDRANPSIDPDAGILITAKAWSAAQQLLVRPKKPECIAVRDSNTAAIVRLPWTQIKA